MKYLIIIVLLALIPVANATAEQDIESIIAETAARYDMAPVRFHVVSAGHRLFERDPAIAKAVRWQDGDEAIYIVSTRISDMSGLRVVLDHEMSHLKAWRLHGEKIHVHGHQWKKTCREYSAFGSRACYKSFQ